MCNNGKIADNNFDSLLISCLFTFNYVIYSMHTDTQIIIVTMIENKIICIIKRM